MNDLSLLLLFFVILIIGGAIFLAIATGAGRRSHLDKKYYQKQWQEITSSVSTDSSTQQFAILQADKLLDRALKEKGYSGATMAERMKKANNAFSQRDAVWLAHKLRNRIAHEDNVRINPVWTEKALRSFQRGLKDLGAL